MGKQPTVTCPRCAHQFPAPFASRANFGNQHQQDLVYLLNASTPYYAENNPLSRQVRVSGARMRPDIKVTLKDGKPGDLAIYVERQEQNVSGTGCDKVADKIQKILMSLGDVNIKRYYLVFAGKRLDLLERAADNALGAKGLYRHERLVICREEVFIARARTGAL